MTASAAPTVPNDTASLLAVLTGETTTLTSGMLSCSRQRSVLSNHPRSLCTYLGSLRGAELVRAAPARARLAVLARTRRGRLQHLRRRRTIPPIRAPRAPQRRRRRAREHRKLVRAGQPLRLQRRDGLFVRAVAIRELVVLVALKSPPARPGLGGLRATGAVAGAAAVNAIDCAWLRVLPWPLGLLIRRDVSTFQPCGGGKLLTS